METRLQRLRYVLKCLDEIEENKNNVDFRNDAEIQLHAEILMEKKRHNSRRKNNYLRNLLQTKEKQHSGYLAHKEHDLMNSEFKTFIYNFKQDVQEEIFRITIK